MNRGKYGKTLSLSLPILSNVATVSIYSEGDRFSRLFPRNRHVKEKLRQTLRRLRDDGFLNFLGGGKYQVNLEYEDLSGDTGPITERGFELPKTKTVVRTLRLRCTLLATEIKRRYASICQLCRAPVVLATQVFYAEAHHLKPLGAPHFGPDVAGNIIVLCPNHHIMFDRGVVTIEPVALKVRHAVEDVLPKDARFFVQPWHCVEAQYLAYHNDRIFRGS